MWLILLYPLFWGIVYWRIRDKKNHPFYRMVILLFLLSALASSYLIFFDPNYVGKQLGFVAIAYHLIMMWLLLYPLQSYDRMCHSDWEQVPSSILTPVTVFIIVLMLVFIANGIQNVSLTAIATDSQELRQLVEEDKTYDSNLLRYVDYIGSTYSIVPLALMFYYMRYRPSSKLIIYLLLVCSLGQAVLSLAEAGREYMIKYVFVFFSLYLLTNKGISKLWRKRIRVFFLGIIIAFGAIFLLITYMRFTYTRDITATSTIINYLGQGNANFTENFVAFPDGVYPKKGQHTFPIIFGHSDISLYNLNSTFSTNVELNVFATGIGSWLRDCGIWLTIIVTLFFSMLFNIVGKIKTYNVFSLIYFALIFEQVFSLLFFFHGSWNGTRILSILILVFLDYSSRHSTQIVIHNK